MQDDADLDPLSAMEKYCRSDLPQQRLAYAAVSGVRWGLPDQAVTALGSILSFTTEFYKELSRIGSQASAALGLNYTALSCLSGITCVPQERQQTSWALKEASVCARASPIRAPSGSVLISA